ncbi:Major Facilitator Superfamily protein [Micromonospora viridifaciens]|uniref:Major Facilitator Superfamily protein n=1 Tax=Micromonospora viridifaciens TaxID=1881 RepID=A0A1C4YAY8_MICVI|nr:MFS transporter [Micromonospora viridifaciens]SCF17864.1 Major Facilitator Superfamily protein [Micromonospora viridifaciens]
MRRNAALFVAISLLSGFGSTTMSLVTGIWLLDLTGSAGLAALASLCVFAPQLAGPWLGAVLDRLPRLAVVVTVNMLLAATLLSLLAVRAADDAWILFAVSLAYGASYVLIEAGESALLPRALSADHLGDVNGWRGSAQEGTKLVAPLAGAGLYAWQGGHLVAMLSAAIPVLVAVLYLAVRFADVSSPSSKRERGLRAGLAVLRREPAIHLSVALAAVAIAMSGFTTAALYQVVTVDLRLPTAFLGVLVSAQGAGSLAAGLIAGRIITRRGPTTVAVVGAIGYAAACLLRCPPWWPANVAASVLAGIGLMLALVAAVTAVQTHTPEHLLGRVSATANTAMFAPLALAIPLGSAAVHLGGRPAFVIAATLCLTTAAVAYRRQAAASGASPAADTTAPLSAPTGTR